MTVAHGSPAGGDLRAGQQRGPARARDHQDPDRRDRPPPGSASPESNSSAATSTTGCRARSRSRSGPTVDGSWRTPRPAASRRSGSTRSTASAGTPSTCWSCAAASTPWASPWSRSSRVSLTFSATTSRPSWPTTTAASSPARSADGMNRAAREGRYTGGIVPFGYRVEGHKASARLVPDEAIAWADRSAADLVRDMYERLALRGQSCRVIAHEFNALGIPTHYARDGRGVRGRRTQGLWRAGRIRNLVVNPLYRGELRYGRRRTAKTTTARSSPPRSRAWSPLPCGKRPRMPWPATAGRQEQRPRLPAARGDPLRHLRPDPRRLRGPLRGPIPLRRRTRRARTDTGPLPFVLGSDRHAIEPAVWADVEACLRNPGDVLDGLDGPAEREAQSAIAEAESITLARALEALEGQRKQATALNIRGRLPDAELDDRT